MFYKYIFGVNSMLWIRWLSQFIFTHFSHHVVPYARRWPFNRNWNEQNHSRIIPESLADQSSRLSPFRLVLFLRATFRALTLFSRERKERRTTRFRSLDLMHDLSRSRKNSRPRPLDHRGSTIKYMLYILITLLIAILYMVLLYFKVGQGWCG